MNLNFLNQKKMPKDDKSNQRRLIIVQDYPSDFSDFSDIKIISKEDLRNTIMDIANSINKKNNKKVIILDDTNKFLNRKKK